MAVFGHPLSRNPAPNQVYPSAGRLKAGRTGDGTLHSFEQVTGKGNERWHPGRLLTGEEREDYEEWAGIIEFEWDYPRDEAERMAYEYVMRERKGSRRRRSEKWTTYE